MRSARTHRYFRPNPGSTGMTRLNYSANEAGELSLRVFDVSGKELWQQTYAVAEGENSIDLQFADLTKGMYFVKMEQGARSGCEKLVIE